MRLVSCRIHVKVGHWVDAEIGRLGRVSINWHFGTDRMLARFWKKSNLANGQRMDSSN